MASATSSSLNAIKHDADGWLDNFRKSDKYQANRRDIQKQTCKILQSLEYISTKNKLVKLDPDLLQQQREHTIVFRHIEPISSNTNKNNNENENETKENESKITNTDTDDSKQPTQDTQDTKQDTKQDTQEDSANNPQNSTQDTTNSDKNDRNSNLHTNNDSGNDNNGTNIYVMNKDCLDIAIELLEKGYNPCVLNMANANTPGGGWQSGSGAQEENLFRRTSYINSLINNDLLDTNTYSNIINNINNSKNNDKSDSKQSKITQFFASKEDSASKSGQSKDNSKKNGKNNNKNTNKNNKKNSGYGIRIERNYGYPIEEFGCVYSPNLFIFRGNEAEGYPLLDKIETVSFIAAAMYARPRIMQLSKLFDDNYAKYATQLHLDFETFVLNSYKNNKNNETNDSNESDNDAILRDIYCYSEEAKINGVCEKLRSLLRVSYLMGHDSLVLSAWGCGAFKNPPLHQAYLFKNVLNEKEFENRFKAIVFAILDDHNAYRAHNPNGNFKPFQTVFGANTLL